MLTPERTDEKHALETPCVADRGVAGRFRSGNRAAAGNRGGGRPPSLLRELPRKDARRIWSELRAVAFDTAHPLHERHGFEALKTLATLTFPKPQAVALEATRVDGLPLGSIVIRRIVGSTAQE